MIKFYKSGALLFLLVLPFFLSQGQSFVRTSDVFVPSYNGKIEWADLDNDKDLDIIYSGLADETNHYFTKVYENNAGAFTSRTTALPNLRNGAFALGDYDNDGDLDVLLIGITSSGEVSALYENKGSFLFTSKYSFRALTNSTMSWFDIDNDKDLDFILNGVDDSTPTGHPFGAVTQIYENVNNTFVEIAETNIQPCTQCSMDWADSNGDGNVDLIICGFGEDGYGHSSLYLNNGDKTFRKDTRSVLNDVYNGDTKWGDFDNDGDMDALLSGMSLSGIATTKVYENDGNSLVERTDIEVNSTWLNWFDGTKWLDFDSDGDLDILVSGRGPSMIEALFVFKLFQNDGHGQFTEIPGVNFEGLAQGSIDVGDYDNDGDVDICFLGITPTGIATGIYKNLLKDELPSLNTKPTPPDRDLFSERNFFRKQLTLNWIDGSDSQTLSDGLTYNFYLRNATSNIVVPTSDFSSGYWLTHNPPNGQGKKSIVRDIPEGTNFWAVQSIDGGKLGSLFSAEKTFYQINGPEALKAEIIDVENVKLIWLDNSLVETSYHILRSSNVLYDFSSVATLAANTTSSIDHYPFLTDQYYYYRIYAANSSKSSAFDSLRVLIPKAPVNLSAHALNSSMVNLNWEDKSTFEAGYKVEKKLKSETDFQIVVTLASDASTFTDEGLSEGTWYDYRVRAVNEFGSSAFSNVISVQTNFMPLGADFEKKLLEDVTTNFTSEDFKNAFSDPDVSDKLVEIVISTLPQKGILLLNTMNVVAGQVIPQASLGSLQFVPSPNANGISSFYFYNSDGKDNSANTNMVTLTIAPVNDTPTLSLIEDRQVELYSEISPIDFKVDDVDDPMTSIILSAISNNESLLKNSSFSFLGDGHERTLHILPEQNKTGETLITLSATDGKLITSTQFKFIVFSITGAAEPLNTQFAVYPNPVTSSLIVQFDNPSGSSHTLVIQNILGQEISRQTIDKSESSIELSEIMNGMYWLKIVGEKGDILFQNKLIKR